MGGHENASILGDLHGVRLRVLKTTEPWRAGLDSLVVSAGPVGGFGSLGMALRRAYPDADWKSAEATRISPEDPVLIPLATDDQAGSERIRHAIVVTVHETRGSTARAGDGPPTLDGVRRATAGALTAAVHNGAAKIGLPLLATGSLGFPSSDVAATMLPAVERMLRTTDPGRRPTEICFVCRDNLAERGIKRAWDYHELLVDARLETLDDASLRKDAATVGLTLELLANLLDEPDEAVWQKCAGELAQLRRVDEELDRAFIEGAAEREVGQRQRSVTRSQLAQWLIDNVMKPRLRLEVTQRQHERARADDLHTRRQEFRRPLNRTDTSALRLPPEKDAVIGTEAGREVFRLLDTDQSMRASIGVAGPRGCGKSTLLRDAYERWATHGIRVFLPAPASYAPREFLLHLYGKVCVEVLSRDPSLPWTDDPQPVRPAAIRSASLLQLVLLPLTVLVTGIGVLVAAGLTGRAGNAARHAAFGAVIVAASCVPLLLSRTSPARGKEPSGRWSFPAGGRILLTTAVCGGLGLLAPSGLVSGRQLAGVVMATAAVGTSVLLPRREKAAQQHDEGLVGRLAAASRTIILLATAAAQLATLIAGIAFIVLPKGVAAPSATMLAGATLAAVGCTTLWAGTRWHALVAGMSRAREAPPADRFSRRARRDLARIRYQTTVMSGWTSTLKMSPPKWLPFGVDAGVSGSTSEADLPLGVPDIVEGIKTLLPSRGPALVVIDELDKIESAEKARDFLNEIKGILDAEDCYFLLSMSEDAISSFERRGLPFRDVFDSAFDEVVRMPYLNASDSVALLGRRLNDVPLQYCALAYCQSAGLPRDLLRAAGRMLSLPAEAPSLAAVTRQIVHRDLRGKTEAVTAVIKLIALEPDVSGVLKILQHLDTCDTSGRRRCILDPAWLDGTSHLSPVLQTATDDLPQRRELLRLTVELLGYAYYCRTLLELFRTDADPEVDALMTAVNDDDGQILDRLAQVQQTFMVNPFVAWELLSAVRVDISLTAYPLPKAFIARAAAAAGDSAG